MKYRLLILILLWISFLIIGAFSFNGLTIVQAATPIIVTTTSDELNDDSSCSLREAIRAANSDSVVSGCAAGSGHDTIILPAGIYTLTIPGVREDAALTGDLDITSHLTIDGKGAGTTVIDGNGNSQTMWDRVFDITVSGQATLKNVTIKNGDVGGGANGGGIRNYGVLTVTNAILSDNIAHAGGGLLNVGTTTIVSSTIKHNTVSSSGGGIRNDATLTIVNSVVYSNTASVGGGISNNSSVTILNSTLSNNHANSNGGGVYNGFGFYNEPPAMLNLNNVTITNNIADADNNGSGSGGGVLPERKFCATRAKMAQKCEK